MAFRYMQLALAIRLPLFAFAAFNGAFVIEYEHNVQAVRRLAAVLRRNSSSGQ